MIRTFVAIRVSGLPFLEQWVAEVQHWPSAKGIRWTHPEYWHVTLRFIGDMEESSLPLLSEALLGNLRTQRGIIKVRGLGFFGREARPKVLWAGVDGTDWLRPLQSSVQKGIEVLGLPDDLRVFNPHLTLARIKKAPLSHRLLAEMESRYSFEWGEVQVSSVVLYKSVLTHNGPVYSVLKTFLLDD